MERVDRELTWEDAVKIMWEEGLDYVTFRVFDEAVDSVRDERFCSEFVARWAEANLPSGYTYQIRWYRFPSLRAHFLREEAFESLVWHLQLYHVIEVDVFNALKQPEGIYWGKSWDVNRCWNTPLKLLKAWMVGELECSGVVLTSTIGGNLEYLVEGTNVIIPKQFHKWFLKLGREPFRKLLKMKVIDDYTYSAVEKAMLEAELPLDLSNKDRERLHTIRRIDKPLTYSEWGRVLGLTREGAYYLLRRFEAKGLVKLTKCERGVKAEVKTP
jgi:hypothetical protein